jgi:hypothetical protein
MLSSLKTALAALLAISALAARSAPSPDLGDATRSHATGDVKRRARAFQIDDDFLGLAQHDRDYTAGVYFTLTDDGAPARALPLSRRLDWTDALTRFSKLRVDAASEAYSLEIGIRLFTPSDLEAENPLPDDRPYANLAYLAGSKLTVDAGGRTALKSTLSLGMLGLPIVGALHRGLHELIASPLPNGYSHQISNGGEPTLRYAISRQRLLASGMHGDRPYSLHYGVGASVGYLSDLSTELVLRSGPLRVPWWSAPMSSGYGGQPATLTRLGAGSSRGVIFEAGIQSRLRLYNAFLQGQFRHSEVTFSSGQLERVLVEGWAGVAFRFENGLELNYAIHRQSREIARGTGARAFTWGQLSFVRRL